MLPTRRSSGFLPPASARPCNATARVRNSATTYLGVALSMRFSPAARLSRRDSERHSSGGVRGRQSVGVGTMVAIHLTETCGGNDLRYHPGREDPWREAR